MSTQSVNPNKPNACRKAAGSNWNTRNNGQQNSNSSCTSSVRDDKEPAENKNNDQSANKLAKRRKRRDPNRVGLYVAMDCEMVGIGPDGKGDMLARVSLVRRDGKVLLDKFVKPQEPVTNYRTAVSGIRPSNMENGEDFSKVRDEVSQLLQGKILVGHGLKNDLTVLRIKHPYCNIRDTSLYKPLCLITSPSGATPSLKKLAKTILNVDIQSGEHNSVEDARAAMNIYNQLCTDWEIDHQKKYSRRHK